MPQDDFSVQIPVTADLAGLTPALDAATQQAAQKGQEAGAAYAQGFAASQGGVTGPGIGGSIGGVGGGVNGPGGVGFGGGINGPGMGGAAGGGPNTAGGGGASVAPAQPMGGPGGQIFDAAAFGVFLNQAMAVFTRFEQIGEKIGSYVFEVSKTQLDLKQSLDMLSASIARQQSTNSDKFSQQAGGVGGRAPGTFVDDEIKRLESENIGLDEKLAKDFGPTDLIDAALDTTIAGVSGGTMRGGTTEREAAQKRREQNDGTLGRLYRQRQGLIESGRENVAGRAIAEAADSFGIQHSPVLAQTGERMGPAEYAAFAAALKENADMTRTLVGVYQSYAGQQNMIRSVTTQGN